MGHTACTEPLYLYKDALYLFTLSINSIFIFLTYFCTCTHKLYIYIYIHMHIHVYIYIMFYVQNCAFLHMYVQDVHYITLQNTGLSAEPILPARIYKHFFLQRHNWKKTVSHNSTIIFQYMKILQLAKKFVAFYGIISLEPNKKSTLNHTNPVTVTKTHVLK